MTIDDVTHKNRLALLHLLTTQTASKEYACQRDNIEVALEAHPFGLETRLPPFRPDNDDRCIVVNAPGWTDGSVHSMLLMLHGELRFYISPTHTSPFRLRIIRAQIAKDWHRSERHVHKVYFELITCYDTFICGGCSDCSGAGNDGRERLESVFNFVAAICDIKVEEVVIPMSKAAQCIRALEHGYAEGEKRRAGMAP